MKSRFFTLSRTVSDFMLTLQLKNAGGIALLPSNYFLL